MARIPVEKALRWAVDQCRQLVPGECLDLLCKKRNRIVRIVKTEDGFRLEERGFFVEDHRAEDLRSLEKLLARLMAREFPRSHLLWGFRRRA
ncbi:MAG: hypothetical protein GXO17_05420 [Thermodesulfobacteria bacterium]|nr:hypothetical protein [Thermodesulfobacteriota bacterium]